MKPLNVAAVTVVLAASLAACGTSTGSSAKTTSSSAVSSAGSSESGPDASSSSDSATSPATTQAGASSGSSSGAATSGATSPSSTSAGGTGAGLPTGTKLVTAPTAGVRFAVPSGWSKVDATLLDNPASKKQLEPMATKLGMTADQLVTQFSARADVVVVDLSGKSSFADNVNVAKAELPVLPTKEQADTEFKKIGATPVGFDTIRTPLGAGAQERYTLPVGGQTAYGVGMFVPSGSGSYRNITVSAGDRASAEKIARDIATSMRKS